MTHKTTSTKHLFDQARLALAEWLIGKAVDIAPNEHPDSVAIYEAAAHISARKPAKADWKCKQ